MFELVPFDKRRGLFDPFRDFEKNFFRDFGFANSFKMDSKDRGDHYIVEADLPGFDKDESKVDITDNILTIAAGRQSETEEKD